MLSENAQQLVSTIAMCVTGPLPPQEGFLQGLANNMRAALAASGREVSDEEFIQVVKELHARLAITMDEGTVIVEQDHVPWLSARKADIDPFYWKRYSEYLIKRRWPPAVVGTLDRVSDETLDLTGNPVQPGPWKRRGLVIGDVQSGKTASYIALCCKAADASYRVIILLTGTLESLRRQTQQRLDEGFVGRDSSEILTRQTTTRYVGAGELDRRRSAGVFTSRTTDFSKNLLNALGFTIKGFREPILLVVKKNKRILANLESWLRAFNADQEGEIDEPLLLIDDEADNASVNTAAIGDDPTAINEGIRALLALFKRASYIGFTATPFANIFIDPDTDDDMLGHDLFPRDFIYTLDPPSNYIGPTRVFGEEGVEGLVYHIEDADEIFPRNHKATLDVSDLPRSLEGAVKQFFVANAIRDLRDEGMTHRSMLVNVSRFTAVQDQVTALLDRRVRAMQQDIRSYSQLGESRALMNPTLAQLRDTWNADYRDLGFTWARVQRQLLASALPITVRAVNQRSGAASLDYTKYASTGLRVIAVGGMSLSRGLTLEGLCVSYFFRNSQMYDTLLQMGRWFGYRDGYDDVCRLWVTPEAEQWYAHITLATEELRDEVKRMEGQSLTPKEFGLKVRSHPDSLIVTARNKMRLAKTIERHISFSGEGPETTKLRADRAAIEGNARALGHLLDGLEAAGLKHEKSEWNNTIWRTVPKLVVAGFLAEFESHPHNFSFYTPEQDRGEFGLAAFIHRTGEPLLQTWDVVIPNGQESEIRLLGRGIMIHPSRRFVQLRDGDSTIMVSGTKARVGSRGIEREGIPRADAEEVERLFREQGKSVPDHKYREIRQRPLLLIHIVNPYGADDNRIERFSSEATPLVAIGLSFPRFDDTGAGKKVSYRVNLVEWRTKFETEADDDVERADEEQH